MRNLIAMFVTAVCFLFIDLKLFHSKFWRIITCRNLAHTKVKKNRTAVLDIPLTNRVRGPYRKLRTEFFPPRFMAQGRRARAINRRGKNEDP